MPHEQDQGTQGGGGVLRQEVCLFELFVRVNGFNAGDGQDGCSVVIKNTWSLQ